MGETGRVSVSGAEMIKDRFLEMIITFLLMRLKYL